MALLTQKISVFSRESNCFDRPPAQQDKLDERLKDLEKLFEVSAETLRAAGDELSQNAQTASSELQSSVDALSTTLANRILGVDGAVGSGASGGSR